MKFISWNVNGIRACLRRNSFDPILKEIKPDVFCLQETKAKQEQVGKIFEEYKHHFWNSAKRPGYSGTAIFTNKKPLSVSYGIQKEEHDQEGRVITLEFEKYFLVNVYVPNSGRGFPRLSYRSMWDTHFLEHLKGLEKKKPVVVCGDLNVAHTKIDLANPDENYNKTAGYTQIEIDGFQSFIDSGFIDSFREFTKEGKHYSWWGAWNNLRARNIGWRIDYFLISKELRKELQESFILPKVMGSDHCPVGIVMKE